MTALLLCGPQRYASIHESRARRKCERSKRRAHRRCAHAGRDRSAYSYRIPKDLRAQRRRSRRSAARARARRSAPSGMSDQARAAISNPSPRAATARRSARISAISSTGWRAGPWRRAAWCCAWRCGHRSAASPEPIRIGIRRAGPEPARMTPARARVLAALEGGSGLSKIRARRSRRAVRPRVIDTLVDEGTCEAVALPPEPVALPCDPDFAPPALEPRSGAAPPRRSPSFVAAHDFSVTLLEGVTGSGKTEVYFEAVAAALREGRQTLDPDAGDRAHRAIPRSFRRALRHAARRMAFLRQRAQTRAHLGAALRSGEIKVVAGARSALFLPFADLAAHRRR